MCVLVVKRTRIIYTSWFQQDGDNTYDIYCLTRHTTTPARLNPRRTSGLFSVLLGLRTSGSAKKRIKLPKALAPPPHRFMTLKLEALTLKHCIRKTKGI